MKSSILHKNLIYTFLLTLFLLFFVSCEKETFSYNNLISNEDREEWVGLMEREGVPTEDIEAVSDYLKLYSSGEYAIKHLKSGWQTASNFSGLYDYTTAINCFSAREFEDINCRQAAFLMYHSFFSAIDIEGNIPDEAKGLPEYLAKELGKFAVLFQVLPLGTSSAETVLNHWTACEGQFLGTSVHLVSLWGRLEGEVRNLHVGIMIEEENGVCFFEKTDPMMPFQLSRFTSAEKVKEYLLSRTDEYEDMIVLFDNKEI